MPRKPNSNELLRRLIEVDEKKALAVVNTVALKAVLEEFQTQVDEVRDRLRGIENSLDGTHQHRIENIAAGVEGLYEGLTKSSSALAQAGDLAQAVESLWNFAHALRKRVDVVETGRHSSDGARFAALEARLAALEATK